MKKCILFIVGIMMMASCSAPKYTYYFDHYNYSAGKKNHETPLKTEQQKSVLAIDESTLTASVKEDETYVAETAPAESPSITREEAVSKIKSMNKEEIKELKKETKRFVKENRKEIKSGQSTTALENDVKLAAIFGAVGIVLLIIGGEVLYVLGAIALLVGLYFFIRWLIHQ